MYIRALPCYIMRLITWDDFIMCPRCLHYILLLRCSYKVPTHFHHIAWMCIRIPWHHTLATVLEVGSSSQCVYTVLVMSLLPDHSAPHHLYDVRLGSTWLRGPGQGGDT